MNTRDRRSCLRLAAGRAHVAFEWAGDRWRHVISVADEPVFASVEGPTATDDDPRWPASPVLTEVTPVTVGGRPAILGLGLAGRSHFSLSVAAHAERADMLVFEVACRIQEPPGWLGTTYRTAAGGQLQAAPAAVTGSPPCTVRWAYAVGAHGLVPLVAAAQPRSP